MAVTPPPPFPNTTIHTPTHSQHTHSHWVTGKQTVLTQNAHVPATASLGIKNDGRQGVVEVLKEGVLQIRLHAQQSVQELADVLVVCQKKNGKFNY